MERESEIVSELVTPKEARDFIHIDYSIFDDQGGVANSHAVDILSRIEQAGARAFPWPSRILQDFDQCQLREATCWCLSSRHFLDWQSKNVVNSALGARAGVVTDDNFHFIALREGILRRLVYIVPDTAVSHMRAHVDALGPWGQSRVDVVPLSKVDHEVSRILRREQIDYVTFSPAARSVESEKEFRRRFNVSDDAQPPLFLYNVKADDCAIGTQLFHGSAVGGLQTVGAGENGELFASPSPAFAACFAVRPDSYAGWVHGVEFISTPTPLVYLIVPQGQEQRLARPGYLYAVTSESSENQFLAAGSVTGFEYSTSRSASVMGSNGYHSSAELLQAHGVSVLLRENGRIVDAELECLLSSHSAQLEHDFQMQYDDLVALDFLQPHLYAWLVTNRSFKPRELGQRYFRIWEQLLSQLVLPTIAPHATVDLDGYHSLEHLHFVGRVAALLALDADEDPFPALVAGALHDLRREDDAPGLDHARASAKVASTVLASEFSPYLNRRAVPLIIDAIREHPRGRVATNYIEACLWDADRVRLAWERGFRARFFNTRLGSEMAQRGDAFTEQLCSSYFGKTRNEKTLNIS